jgi:P-type Cu+ transporter
VLVPEGPGSDAGEAVGVGAVECLAQPTPASLCLSGRLCARIADRICAVFVPAVLACSALTLAGWLLAGSPASHAFSAALAVLIIACPCALGLVTPAALVVASGRGAQLGIFIKGYQALESSRAIDTVVLDKTGTVTTGQMTVTGVLTVPGVSRGDMLRFAGSVEQASEHADGFRVLPGLGARGTVGGHEVTVGRMFRNADYALLVEIRPVSSARRRSPIPGCSCVTRQSTLACCWYSGRPGR